MCHHCPAIIHFFMTVFYWLLFEKRKREGGSRKEVETKVKWCVPKKAITLPQRKWVTCSSQVPWRVLRSVMPPRASEEAKASESRCSQWPGASAFLPGSTDFEFMVVRDNTEVWGFTTESYLVPGIHQVLIK